MITCSAREPASGANGEKPARWTVRELVDADGARYRYAYNPVVGIVLSIFVGFISSLLGVGGGFIHVPALSRLLNFPVHIATATSHFVLAVMALDRNIGAHRQRRFRARRAQDRDTSGGGRPRSASGRALIESGRRQMDHPRPSASR